MGFYYNEKQLFINILFIFIYMNHKINNKIEFIFFFILLINIVYNNLFIFCGFWFNKKFKTYILTKNLFNNYYLLYYVFNLIIKKILSDFRKVRIYNRIITEL